MFDLERYPHLRQEIISYLDRPALCTFARTSRSSQRAATPFLYPSTLFDPLYTLSTSVPRTTGPAPAFSSHHQSRLYPNPAQTSPPELSPERIEQRLSSLLSSPHLSRSRTIVIANPQNWARDMVRLISKPIPASRDEGTVTIIRVEPMIDRRADWASARGWTSGPNGESRRCEPEPEPEVRGPTQAYFYPGLMPDHHFRGPISCQSPASTRDNHFQYLFDIASLLPSDRLVLYVPGDKGINLTALIKAAYLSYGSPAATMRKVTIVVTTGNHIDPNMHTSPPFRRVPDTRIWDAVELVFLPTSSDTLTFATPSLPIENGTPSAYASSGILDTFAQCCLVASPIFIAVRTQVYTNSYTVVGVEGLAAAQAPRTEAFKERVLASCKGMLARAGAAEKLEMKYVALEDWDMRASILADCAVLGGRRA